MPRGSADEHGVSDEHDSRSIRFDPSRVDDLIDDLQSVFDGAKVGRYDDPQEGHHHQALFRSGCAQVCAWMDEAWGYNWSGEGNGLV